MNKTPMQLHRERWSEGCGGDVCNLATRIVLARGQYPCDLLFVGQSPGNSENTLGYPFVGPAGHLLDRVIARVQEDYPFRWAITNLVGCMPRSESTGRKEHDPKPREVHLCTPRLEDFVDNVARPKGILCLGKTAWDYLDPKYVQKVRFSRRYDVRQTLHPAAVLRMPESEQGYRPQEMVVTLRNFLIDIQQGNQDEKYEFA